MPEETRKNVMQEAELVDRFVGTYRQRLAELILTLNHAKSAVDNGRAEASSVRSCVEAVDFVLASHAEFARSLRTDFKTC
jgi:hypothetical protein